MNHLLPTPLYSMYRLVCNSPDCGGIAIARMPQLIEQDFTTNTTSHTHAYYEILWFEEAGGIHTVDFEDYPIQSNTLLFLTPGQMHRFDGETKHKGYSVILCTEFFERYRDATDLVRCNLFHSDNQSPCGTLPEASVPLVRTIMEKMLHEQSEAQYGNQEMLRLLARILLLELHRNAIRKNAIKPNEQSVSERLFVKFRNLLEQEYTHLHLVSEYAERLDVSTKTLTNAVKSVTGQTPLEYINERLLLDSKRLLRFSDLMVKEIAFQLGFNDPSNFVKFFKRQTGYLPSDFQLRS